MRSTTTARSVRTTTGSSRAWPCSAAGAAVGTWNIRICELLVADHDRRVARRLLRRVLGVAAVDYVTCHFPPHSVERSAAVRCGFIRFGYGEEVLLVCPLDPTVTPDPTLFASWALALGDVELL